MGSEGENGSAGGDIEVSVKPSETAKSSEYAVKDCILDKNTHPLSLSSTYISGGKKRNQILQQITVDIEKGMHDGQEVVIYEKGEPKIDGEAGDLKLKFRIRTAPHNHFRKEGNDLHTTVTITLVQALVCFEKSIKHLDEHPVDISSKGIIVPKQVRKFKGEGMALHYSNKKGDLYVTFEVLFPTSLTNDQKKRSKKFYNRHAGNSHFGFYPCQQF
ncbi:dnaJ protein ERDJ3B-like [Andrographis paniculata]|uniref:dnaJ protein ERDJ3B-like n=1 Tax=Andrographis paniculata TaxID=175694 RepID=UPI0021E992BC|nr:dnaJ protein ERDJ3B-like [Andrographis paniculata]